MVEYNKYPEYKDSGIDWLGEIPSDWDALKIHSLFNERSEKVSDKDFAALSVTKNGIVPQLSTAVKTDNGDSRKKVLSGDFVINSRSDRKGSSGVSLLDGSVSLISTVLTPNQKIFAGYAHHILRSVNFQEEYYRYGRGIVADLWTTRYKDMRNISITVPPIETQKQIVALLDAEIDTIDGSVSSMESLISLLTEKRAALISETVTRGVPGDHTDFKDSGVEWLGEIPIGWKVLDPKNVFSAKSDNSLEGDVHLMASQKYGVIPQAEYLENTGKRVVEVFSSEARFKHIDCDDFLIHLRSFQGGIEHCINTGKVTAAYTIVSPKLGVVVPLYAKYLLKSRCYIGGIASTTNQLRDGQSVKWKDFRKILLPIPSVKEQNRIAQYLAKELFKVDTLINEAQKSIKLLQEKRQTLISDVITGKIDVRNSFQLSDG